MGGFFFFLHFNRAFLLCINGCDNWDLTAVTYDHACNQSKLSCANWFWSHMDGGDLFFSCISKFCLVLDAGMFPKPSQWQGSSTAAQRHLKQPGSEGLPETRSNVPMRAMGMAWTHTNPEQITASHTSTCRLFLIYLSQAELQAPAWHTAVMHCRYLCACFTSVCISTGHSNPQVGRPECTRQEKKGRALPSLQFTLQLEGCLQNVSASA